MQAADTADQKLADQRNGKHIVKKNQKQISLPPHPHVKGKPGYYVVHSMYPQQTGLPKQKLSPNF